MRQMNKRQMSKRQMSKIQIKICGLRREEDIKYVNECLPEYIGFVFAESKRKVDKKQAKVLKEMLSSKIQAVGVFVNAALEEIEELCSENVIDIVQLHGEEDIVYIESLRERISNPIIKAIRVRSQEQILEEEKMPCEMLLLDTYTKGEYGGSGKDFDLQMIPELEKPYFLAGGLQVETIKEKLAQVNPYAVDISSGVETDGIKDFQKIKEFVKKIREER